VTRQVLLMGSLLGVLGCTPSVVAPPSQAVHRIAVLPPYSVRGNDFPPAETSNDALNPRQMTVGQVLAEQARGLLAEKGYEVVDPSIVKKSSCRRFWPRSSLGIPRPDWRRLAQSAAIPSP
jgi:hypothetical protein